MGNVVAFPKQVVTLEEILAAAGERVQNMQIDDPLELKFMLAMTSENTDEAERLLSILERKAALGLSVMPGGGGRGKPFRGQ